MKTKTFVLILFLSLCSSLSLFSQTADWEYPLIKGFGRIHYLSDAAVQPDKSLDYKVLFGIIHPSEKGGDINIGLDHVARYINLFSAANMPQAKLSVIVGGPAVTAVLNNEAYKEKFGVDNPNTPLLKTLKDKGVEIFVCGQSLGDFNVKKETVDQNVTVALSFMVVATTYQLKGYSSLLFF